MYKLLLAIRYLLRRRITLLAIMAVMLCVFMVVIVMTVMIGLVDDFTKKNHEFFSDCIISTESLVGFAHYQEFLAELDKQEFVQAAAPVMKSVAMLSIPGRESNMIVELMGIDTQRHIKATNFAETIYYHADNPENVFAPSYDKTLPGCVIGIEKVSTGRDPVTGEYYHSPRPSNIRVEISTFPLTAKGALAKAGTDVVNSKFFYYSDDCHSGIVRLPDGARSGHDVECAHYVRIDVLPRIDIRIRDRDQRGQVKHDVLTFAQPSDRVGIPQIAGNDFDLPAYLAGRKIIEFGSCFCECLA